MNKWKPVFQKQFLAVRWGKAVFLGWEQNVILWYGQAVFVRQSVTVFVRRNKQYFDGSISVDAANCLLPVWNCRLPPHNRHSCAVPHSFSPPPDLQTARLMHASIPSRYTAVASYVCCYCLISTHPGLKHLISHPLTNSQTHSVLWCHYHGDVGSFVKNCYSYQVRFTYFHLPVRCERI